MLSSPCNTKNLCQDCKLSGHWEENCWILHPKLDPEDCMAKRSMQRVKVKDDQDLTTTFTATKEANFTNEVDNMLMSTSRASQIQLFLSILHQRFPFPNMCKRLMHRDHSQGVPQNSMRTTKASNTFIVSLAIEHMNDY